ncbi:NAD-dependent protein deacetylase [Oleiagrimonas sp. C23AA]|uniref:NAD-dependent protein deacetylase n=1 Tax=Oleiagrimonas sp. C23AA TaxID=2719047 RepID=UPI00141ED47F|nr:NAD-dependent protein deacetylase [Oleiagrimonas sp. C23AA]NII10472.1 NAD-dependent protein deacetylase [Oleiagrimonas sp. C23AA]
MTQATALDPDFPATLDALRRFVADHPRLCVLTGAGCSTDSGIPDYRDSDGQWKRPQPITLQAFMGETATRARYWARSLVGWRFFGNARPNATHHALAELERRGHVPCLITQNVDRLHQAAGSEQVIDLHGRLDVVRCMQCDTRSPRDAFQTQLADLNPEWAALSADTAPDGDADLDGHDFARFRIPPCPICGGILKPDVVFFGEGVPRERVQAAGQALEAADALLVVGSSLMVYSGYRFARAAARRGQPIAAINLGRTRADDLLQLKVSSAIAPTLRALLDSPEP